MNEVDKTKQGNGRGAARQTRRLEISLPVASARVLEAAAILGGYGSVDLPADADAFGVCTTASYNEHSFGHK